MSNQAIEILQQMFHYPFVTNYTLLHAFVDKVDHKWHAYLIVDGVVEGSFYFNAQEMEEEGMSLFHVALFIECHLSHQVSVFILV